MAESAIRGDANRAIEAVWRIESARLLTALTRMVHDVGHAEDLAEDSRVAALESWPKEGVLAQVSFFFR